MTRTSSASGFRDWEFERKPHAIPGPTHPADPPGHCGHAVTAATLRYSHSLSGGLIKGEAKIGRPSCPAIANVSGLLAAIRIGGGGVLNGLGANGRFLTRKWLSRDGPRSSV